MLMPGRGSTVVLTPAVAGCLAATAAWAPYSTRACGADIFGKEGSATDLPCRQPLQNPLQKPAGLRVTESMLDLGTRLGLEGAAQLLQQNADLGRAHRDSIRIGRFVACPARIGLWLSALLIRNSLRSEGALCSHRVLCSKLPEPAGRQRRRGGDKNHLGGAWGSLQFRPRCRMILGCRLRRDDSQPDELARAPLLRPAVACSGSAPR